MADFLNELKYFFKSLKQKDTNNKIQTSYSNKNSKLIIGAGANVTINAKVKKNIEDVRSSVSAIVKQTDANPNKLLEYIKASNTPVYRINNADKLLNLICEEEGLICEQRGLRALYLSFITGEGFKLQTKPMFVLREGIIEKYYFLHHFYRWYSLKLGLPGFDYNSQSKFKKYLIHNTKEDTKRLNISDILDIQEAISRDQEATSFVLQYTKEKDGSKNVMDKIKNDGGASI